MRNVTKFIMGVALSVSSVLGGYAQTTPNFTTDQYQKALWMTTRFYGAQRSGHGPNWLIADYEPTDVANDCNSNLSAFVKGKSYIKDADGSYDLTGGWYDCGDFATFGQTFFYSAYMLVLGYLEFPAGYDDYYSTDYHGYIKAGDYTWEGGKGEPDGIPDVLNEAKYATDFILKCVRDENTFYYQKGDGDADHKIWCTSPTKSTLTVSNGGESDGSRYIGKATGSVTSMASLAGAALAAMSQAYAKFDPAYAKECLEKAKTCYTFVTKTTKGNSGACAFYGNKPKYITDETIFYAEMYRATGEKQYLTAAETAASSWMTEQSGYNHNFSLCYNNTEDLGCYLMASISESSYSSYGKTALAFLADLYKPTSGYFLNVKNDSWGVLRFPANQAFVRALNSKLNGDDTIDPYALASVEYIMGKNGKNFSYIVGFGSNHPFYPHHRNFYRTDNNNEGNLPNITSSYKYVQLGYLVGGSLSDGAYEDVEKSYTYSEGGIDYNAGLVGALGYINSMISPVNTNKFGHPSPDLGDDISLCGRTSVVLNSNVEAAGERLFTWYKDGVQVESSKSATSYTATSAGEYTCKIDSAGEWQTEGSVVVKSVLPDVEVEESYELCDPSTVTLDLTMDANVSYQWSKDGKALSGETKATYTITSAGLYSCEITATSCPSVTKSMTVTSLLPEVEDAESTADGKVTLKVLSEGEYEWYDVAEGGTLLASGGTYSTVIASDTYFYVQNAGSMSLVVGPKQSAFTSTGVNWGNIGARFNATKSLMITSIDVYILDVYNSGSQTVEATLEYNGTKTTYTSDAFTPSKSAFSTVTFSDPITISEAGSYSLTLKPSNSAIAFFSDGGNYSTFVNQGDPITFTGNTNQGDGGTGFPGYANWGVTTGSGCARAVVKAIKGNGTDVNEQQSAVCSVYPNPCKDVLYLNLPDSDGETTVEIFNLLGSLVKSEKNVQSSVLVSDLSKGIYLVRVTKGGSTYVTRIVKE